MSDQRPPPLEKLDVMAQRHRTELSDLKSRQATERSCLYQAMRERREALPKRPVGRPRKEEEPTTRPKQIEWRDGERLEIQ